MHTERADATAERAELRARIMYTLGLCQGEISGMGVAVEAFDQARREIDTIPSAALRARLHGSVDGNQGLMVMRLGQPDQAVEWFSRYISYAEQEIQLGGHDPSLTQGLVSCLLNRGFAYAAVRKRDPAIADLERVIKIGGEHNLPQYYPFAVHALGNVHKQSGDLAEALRRYEESGAHLPRRRPA
ncbi:hypothetical protein [Lentzea flaviverrucosa]|uniref:hypothetical protein n=1 Tax=Lentzea flaviverrucosa TaxID=200379 RepID=UPI0011C071B6|nr:hypothetical protein [Lentzea flaviverrucosa]